MGEGLATGNVVLVGARDIDPPEQRFLEDSAIEHVAVGPDLETVLRRAIGGRPVYLHLDCDVLEPDVVPTDYRVPAGMSLRQLRRAAEVLAESEIVGVEIGEFESDADVDRTGLFVGPLLDALEPVLAATMRAQRGATREARRDSFPLPTASSPPGRCRTRARIQVSCSAIAAGSTGVNDADCRDTLAGMAGAR